MSLRCWRWRRWGVGWRKRLRLFSSMSLRFCGLFWRTWGSPFHAWQTHGRFWRRKWKRERKWEWELGPKDAFFFHIKRPCSNWIRDPQHGFQHESRLDQNNIQQTDASKSTGCLLLLFHFFLQCILEIGLPPFNMLSTQELCTTRGMLPSKC